MNVMIGDFEVIVRHPTALEAAGATIVSRPEVWIPPDVATLRRNHGRLWKWRRCGNRQPISTPAWESRTEREIPTFPQAASCFRCEERTEKNKELNDAVNPSTESDQAQKIESRLRKLRSFRLVNHQVLDSSVTYDC